MALVRPDTEEANKCGEDGNDGAIDTGWCKLLAVSTLMLRKKA